MVDFLVDHGAYGIFALGSASEFAYMNLRERIEIVKIIRDQLKSKIPLLMGIGDPSLKNSLKLIKEGLEFDIDGFVATIPQYFLLDKSQIKLYFTEIKKNCNDKPLFAYEVSEVVPTTAKLSPNLIVELLDTKIIHGMKYSGVLWEDYAKIVLESVNNRDSIKFFAGSEIITRNIYEAGFQFDGGIYSALNLFPRLYRDTFKGITNKDEALISKVLPLFLRAGGLMGAMGSAGTQSVMKETLKAIGLPIESKVRQPLPPLKKRVHKKIKNLIETLSQEGYLDEYE
jgi:dihydrodipicolinate synthase/N-acetylneuraminate lyase